MMNTIPGHIQAPLQRLIVGGLPVHEIAIMMQLSEKAVKREIERIVAASAKTRTRAAGR
jgi:DNA-binding NarL/FixJ family response regulator